MIVRLFCCLLGGLLTGLAVAPFSLSYTAWFGLIPLWFSIIHLLEKNQSTRFSLAQFRLGISFAIAWGLGFYGLALFWITGVHPLTWMGVPWLASLGIAAFCWLAITGWGIILVSSWAIAFILWQKFIVFKTPPFQRGDGGDLVNAFKAYNDKQNSKFGQLSPFQRGAMKGSLYNIIGRILGGVTLWCILETLWTHSPLWWSPLAYTQSPNNLWFLQWGQLSGPNTLTAFIVLINGILAEILLLIWKNKLKLLPSISLLIIPVSLIIIIHLTGYFIYIYPLADQPQNQITVGIIQGNIPNKIKLYPEGLKKAIAGYSQGYQALVKSGAEVILTPEGALPYFWEDIVNYSPFYQAILQEKIPVWLGAYGHQENNNDDYTNSLFSVNGQGELIGRYDKVKLVPLGEYIPLKAILGKMISRLSPLKGELSSGNPQQIFNTTFGQAIVSICYESAFPERIREQVKLGGEFILSSANNAHYSDKMPAQHHALDVMRAIESDRWVARATNTGYSAIISPKGETLWLSNLNQYQIYQGKIYRRQTQTFYVKYGDLLTPLLTVISLVFGLISAILIRLQSKRSQSSF